MLPVAFIDPLVFAIHPHATDVSSVDLARNRLSVIRNFNTQQVSACTHSETYKILAEASHYPDKANIERIFKSIGLHHISASDICLQIKTILEKLPTAQSLAGINEILTENVNISGVKTNSAIAGYTKCFADFGAIYAILSHVNKVVPQSILLMSDLHKSGDVVTLSGQIPLIDPQNILPEEKCNFSYQTTAASWDDYLSSFDAEALWNSAKSSKCLRLALYVEAIRECKTSCKPLPNWDDIQIGKEFLASLVGHQAIDTGKFSGATFKKCVGVITGRIIADPMYQPDGSKGGDRSHQETRLSDGALAFRVHIAKESEAPRLMIWQKGDVWTFANVANKNDVRIDCAELEGAAL